MAAGVAVSLALPLVTATMPRVVTRALFGWNVGVWLYLVAVALMM